MMNASRIAIATTSLLLSAALVAAAPAGTPAQLCAAAKNKAAFQQAAASGKCYQKALKDDADVDAACLAKAYVKLTAAIAKADAKGGCLITDDAVVIGSTVETCVANILAVTPGSTPTCSIPPACTAGPTCLELVDNDGTDPASLRMARLDLSAPTALTGLVGSLIENGLGAAAPDCNLFGGGTFNWLLSVDAANDTLKTGGAKPVADPSLGYSFTDGVVSVGATTVNVAPVTLTLGLGASNAFSTSAADVIVPIYLDPSGANAILLPIRGLRVTGQLSGDRSCIGMFDAASLDPASGCMVDSGHPGFTTGGTVHGAINLEDADAIVVSAIGQSLCVLLSGNASTYGDGGNPTRCLRDNGTIVLPGDYCSATGTPGGCADSLELSGAFAANGIKVNQ